MEDCMTSDVALWNLDSVYIYMQKYQWPNRLIFRRVNNNNNNNIVIYSFSITKWKLNEIKRLDAETREMLTQMRMHHPKSDVDRLHVLRALGSWVLIQLEPTLKTTTIGLEAHLTKTNDPLLQTVKRQIHSINKEAAFFKKQLIPETLSAKNEANTIYTKQVKTESKTP